MHSNGDLRRKFLKSQRSPAGFNELQAHHSKSVFPSNPSFNLQRSVAWQQISFFVFFEKSLVLFSRG